MGRNWAANNGGKAGKRGTGLAWLGGSAGILAEGRPGRCPSQSAAPLCCPKSLPPPRAPCHGSSLRLKADPEGGFRGSPFGRERRFCPRPRSAQGSPSPLPAAAGSPSGTPRPPAQRPPRRRGRPGRLRPRPSRLLALGSGPGAHGGPGESWSAWRLPVPPSAAPARRAPLTWASSSRQTAQ